ncbi:hypothetical protein M427DRAFT_147149 [Gonapodya prolifera JEL478]|uniref:Uncharacterized protein n=1 Tax=Gonapodya prolifera (strain JEL478) TaxID=1344416 RepID=A0A139A729_GONPJ|nr:hypothetical protein M427DRAFT_147149 [Gonapodya prolifera JEL478]|eukprot:KXS12458.1 hypothetical protein M427DRAFT_147149 [Gonapodya prolifera JEL478]
MTTKKDTGERRTTRADKPDHTAKNEDKSDKDQPESLCSTRSPPVRARSAPPRINGASTPQRSDGRRRRSVHFCESVQVRFTYEGKDYDRRPVPIAVLTPTDSVYVINMRRRFKNEIIEKILKWAIEKNEGYLVALNLALGKETRNLPLSENSTASSSASGVGGGILRPSNRGTQEAERGQVSLDPNQEIQHQPLNPRGCHSYPGRIPQHSGTPSDQQIAVIHAMLGHTSILPTGTRTNLATPEIPASAERDSDSGPHDHSAPVRYVPNESTEDPEADREPQEQEPPVQRKGKGRAQEPTPWKD